VWIPLLSFWNLHAVVLHDAAACATRDFRDRLMCGGCLQGKSVVLVLLVQARVPPLTSLPCDVCCRSCK